MYTITVEAFIDIDKLGGCQDYVQFALGRGGGGTSPNMQ